ncbi:MAG: hypothetical protein M1829_005994 [Trizodia sp. TS-e1964]|nr:MAG: hypothetical protein M1829_005994 [Trizodia sp. TS-e1964]
MPGQSLFDGFQAWSSKAQNNLSGSFSRLTITDYIRLIVVVGGYCLLRPYLLQISGKFQANDHNRELDPDEMSSAAALSPGSLRGQITVPEDSDDDLNEDGKATGASWGREARRRQRRVIKEILDAEEELLRQEQDDEEDKDIQEFLID